MQKIFTLVFACIVSMTLSAQTAYFNDFEDAGANADILLFDEDGLTPAANVNFVTDAFVFEETGWSQGVSAISTSWFDPLACCADDWMILPAVEVPEGAILQWDHSAPDASYLDGFEVYVGTTPTVAGMTDNIFSLGASQTTWETSTVADLSAYAGQTVHFAFRNNSNDKFLLGIDNIFIGTLEANNIELTDAGLETTILTSPGDATIPVSITVKNGGSSAITSFDATYSFNGGSGNTQSVTGVNIATGESYTFNHETPVVSGASVGNTLEVSITNVNGGMDPDQSDNSLTNTFEIKPTIPDWTLVDVQGNNVRLHDELAAGNVIILDFMASWCGPCESSTPELDDIYTSYGGADGNVKAFAITIEPGDNVATMNSLGWGGTYPKFHYNASHEEWWSHYNVDLGLLSAADQGGIPYFVAICPNVEDPSYSTVVLTDVGYFPGMLNPGWVTGIEGCLESIGACPGDVTAAASGTTLTAADGYDSYQWWLNGEMIPGATGATYTATESGSYTVQANAGGDCESISAAIDVEVCPAAVEVSAAGFDLTASEGYDSYQWWLDGATIDGATGASYSAGADGVYAVQAFLNGACESISEGITVTGTGIEDVSAAGIRVYPNPAKDVLFIEVENTASVTIFDLQGRAVKTITDLNAGINTIEVSDLNAGVYMMTVDTDKGSFQSRIVLNR